MITGERKQEYLDFFNRSLSLAVEIQDVKMITDLDDAGKPVAVAVFSNCSAYNMEIAIAAAPNWKSSRQYIRECAKYAFVRCGVLRLTSYTPEAHSKSLKFSQRLGFEREFDGVLKHWFGKIDGVQMVMFKDNCKWIKG